MGMLDRYKKKGGFVQLLILIETSSKQKQEQFLNLIKQENDIWEKSLRSKMLSVEHVLKWPSSVLVEVFTRVQPLTLAVAFHGQTQEQLDITFNCLSNAEKRKLLLKMSELNPAPSEKASCMIKLLGEVRALIIQNIIKLEKFDQDLFIPENFEEKMHHESEANRSSFRSEKSDVELVFPNENNSTDSHEEMNNSAQTSHKDELEFLKRKVNQLISENNQLKHDYQVVKNKLEQIKKIA